jgi:hypothetical protein
MLLRKYPLAGSHWAFFGCRAMPSGLAGTRLNFSPLRVDEFATNFCKIALPVGISWGRSEVNTRAIHHINKAIFVMIAVVQLL